MKIQGENLNRANANNTIRNEPEFASYQHSEKVLPPLPLSVTHRHLLSCVKTWIESNHQNPELIRILDVGCGDGLLVKYLTDTLLQSHGHLSIEIYGMDVHDHGVQPPGYWAQTLKFLSKNYPTIDWSTRFFLVSVYDDWPFADDFFDVVISNQVLEHVGNHNHFFSEHKRVLRDQGVGYHLFPLWHCIIEPHLRLPLVHWISNRELCTRAITWATKIGFGKYKGTPSDLPKYAMLHAIYLKEQVNYKTQRQIAKSARGVGLYPSFSKSQHYYTQKLRAIFGKPFAESYPPNYTILGHVLAVLLRYVSSSTLELRAADAQRSDNGLKTSKRGAK